ncbi:hypothetical protein NSQ55_03530 [Paenibacillus sp. FSL H7-0943]|uniref:hypothetical protein n=1 Tax=Paenibacillus sp. FSL H7-0943 TaxID=2954739 RepID=UPI0030D5A410
MKCTSCGRTKTNIGGVGSQAEYYCENPNCPSHYTHISCPTCHEVDKKVTTQGIGDQVFTCTKCGHVYTSDDVE